jgi:hypothetical protein
MGVNPQRSNHCGVWVEFFALAALRSAQSPPYGWVPGFFLRYHLSETGIAFEKKHQEGTALNVCSIFGAK